MTEKILLENAVNKENRRFLRMQEAATHYGMGLTSFRKLAYEANAVYRIRKIVLVNLDLFEKYLEEFRECND